MNEISNLEKIATQLQIASRFAGEGTLPSLLEYAGMLFDKKRGHLPTNLLWQTDGIPIDENPYFIELGKQIESVISPTGFHVTTPYRIVSLDSHDTTEPYFNLFYENLDESIGKIDPCTRTIHFAEDYLNRSIEAQEKRASLTDSERGRLAAMRAAKAHFKTLCDLLGAYGITTPV